MCNRMNKETSASPSNVDAGSPLLDIHISQIYK